MGAYSYSEIIRATNMIHDAVDERIAVANATGTLEELLSEYGINLYDTTTPQIIERNMKILVIGDIRGRKSDYVMAAKKLGIPESSLEFIDYDEIKNFSLNILRYSPKYSDIIVGPIPHKIKDLKEDTSLIGMIENAPDKKAYPKLTRVTTNMEGNVLKFSVSAFKEALLKTNLIVKLNEVS